MLVQFDSGRAHRRARVVLKEHNPTWSRQPKRQKVAQPKRAIFGPSALRVVRVVFEVESMHGDDTMQGIRLASQSTQMRLAGGTYSISGSAESRLLPAGGAALSKMTCKPGLAIV
jgi:hypothetical protein